jgi:hypothetical protein
MKTRFVLLLLACPLLGIVFFSLNQHQLVPPRDKISQIVPVPERKVTMGVNAQENHVTHREQKMIESTDRKLDLAVAATKLKPSDFRGNADFLLKKYEPLFDAWGISDHTRRDFVQILEDQSVQMAAVSLQSSMAWPLQVGHAINRKLNTEHTKRSVESFKQIQEDTQQRLASLVGDTRALEFDSYKKGKLLTATSEDKD